MPLKYTAEISKLPCNMEGFSARVPRVCYRWVFDDIRHPLNFLPLYHSDQNGVPEFNAICKGWALSLFVTKEQAIERYNARLKSKPFFYQKVGTHIAKGQLVKEHGISDKEDKNGHFSLFENEEVDLSKAFVIEHKIYDNA